MLVLSRKPGERLHVGGGITITVLGVQGKRVRVGIEAPPQVAIKRGELPGERPEAPGDEVVPSRPNGQTPIPSAPLLPPPR